MLITLSTHFKPGMFLRLHIYEHMILCDIVWCVMHMNCNDVNLCRSWRGLDVDSLYTWVQMPCDRSPPHGERTVYSSAIRKVKQEHRSKHYQAQEQPLPQSCESHGPPGVSQIPLQNTYALPPFSHTHPHTHPSADNYSPRPFDCDCTTCTTFFSSSPPIPV